jgi:hypothetical protein
MQPKANGDKPLTVPEEFNLESEKRRLLASVTIKARLEAE